MPRPRKVHLRVLTGSPRMGYYWCGPSYGSKDLVTDKMELATCRNCLYNAEAGGLDVPGSLRKLTMLVAGVNLEAHPPIRMTVELTTSGEFDTKAYSTLLDLAGKRVRIEVVG